jgi:hypothetical protein
VVKPGLVDGTVTTPGFDAGFVAGTVTGLVTGANTSRTVVAPRSTRRLREWQEASATWPDVEDEVESRRIQKMQLRAGAAIDGATAKVWLTRLRRKRSWKCRKWSWKCGRKEQCSLTKGKFKGSVCEV